MRFIKKELPYLLFVLPTFILYTTITVIPILNTFFLLIYKLQRVISEYEIRWSG